MALPLYQGTPEYFPAQRPAVDTRVASRPRRRHVHLVRILFTFLLLISSLTVSFRVLTAGADYIQSQLRSTSAPPVWASYRAPQSTVTAINATASARGGFLTITGVAVNRGSAALSNVEVEAVLKNQNGAVIGLQQALLPQQVMTPRRQYAFRLDMHAVSAAASFTLHFHRLLGRDLG